jgi:hypothetical protein
MNMQAIERRIVLALVADMRKSGFEPAAVWDGEEYQMIGNAGHVRGFPSDDAHGHIRRALTDTEVLTAVDSVDDSTIHFTHQGATTWGNRGVYIVLGNGCDCISDYHCAESEPRFAAILEGISERIDAGVFA